VLLSAKRAIAIATGQLLLPIRALIKIAPTMRSNVPSIALKNVKVLKKKSRRLLKQQKVSFIQL
jgi:hypothetical protein